MQHRASAAPSIPRAHPQRGHTAGQTAPEACVLISMHTQTHTHIHTHIFMEGNPPSEAKPAQEPNPPQSPSSSTGKDICSQFHLQVATLRWLQDLDGGYPPQHSQHSHIPASNEPFSNKPWTCPRDARAPLPGYWKGGKGQHRSSPKAESSLVLHYAKNLCLG